MDGGAWWAAIYGVAKSQTRLKWLSSSRASLVAQAIKNLPVIWETQVQSLGQKDPLEKVMATILLANILAWRIPWTEDPSGLHSM